ncbi:MAG: imidazolonepropionase [Thermodesulfobacteriota bacterium]
MNGSILITNAAELVTCSGFSAKCGPAMSDLGIISNGAVEIRDGVITAVGPAELIAAGHGRPDRKVIDAAGKAVLPGFVDPHSHFLFAGYRADEFCLRLQGAGYMEIMRQGGGIRHTVAATRRASRDSLIKTGLLRLDRMLASGVTTVEGKSGYGLDRDTEIKQLEVMAELDTMHPVDVVRTFLGAHALPDEYSNRSDAYIDFLCEELLPQVADQQLAGFCDVFCEKNVFSVSQSRRLLRRAQSLGLAAKLHADELEPMGGAELAADLGAVSADHLLRSSPEGIRKMARAGVVAVLLPATAFCLREPYARARFMIDEGCAVALATDLNPGSCFSGSIPLLFALATLYMNMSPEEAVTALTINAAAAISRETSVGSLDVGKQGDLVILEFPSYRYLPYHTGVDIVETVVKAGNIVHQKPGGKHATDPAHPA